MASAADFASWAEPNLVIPLGGRDGVVRDFIVRPPSLGDAAKLLACAVRGEVNLGIVKGPIPDEVLAVLDTIGVDEHPALGPAYQEMIDAGVAPRTIDRMSYYAVFYWARGEQYADSLARLLFTPRVTDDLFPEGGDGEAPKAS